MNIEALDQVLSFYSQLSKTHLGLEMTLIL